MLSRSYFHFHIHDSNVTLLFAIGLPKVHERDKEHMLRKEIAQYGDLLRLDYVEDYHKLSYKGLGVFSWIRKCSEKLKFLIKGDDDNTFIYGMVYLHLEEALFGDTLGNLIGNQNEDQANYTFEKARDTDYFIKF